MPYHQIRGGDNFHSQLNMGIAIQLPDTILRQISQQGTGNHHHNLNYSNYNPMSIKGIMLHLPLEFLISLKALPLLRWHSKNSVILLLQLLQLLLKRGGDKIVAIGDHKLMMDVEDVLAMRGSR